MASIFSVRVTRHAATALSIVLPLHTGAETKSIYIGSTRGSASTVRELWLVLAPPPSTLQGKRCPMKLKFSLTLKCETDSNGTVHVHLSKFGQDVVPFAIQLHWKKLNYLKHVKVNRKRGCVSAVELCFGVELFTADTCLLPMHGLHFTAMFLSLSPANSKHCDDVKDVLSAA